MARWCCYIKIAFWDAERQERGELSVAQYDLDTKGFCDTWLRVQVKRLSELIKAYSPDSEWVIRESKIWKR